MVKVKDGLMAEAKPVTTTTSTTTTTTTTTSSTIHNNNTTHSHVRKPRIHNHTHHIHQTLHHYTYFHHHCTHPTGDNVETNGSPAKFYFGPGFEPQLSSGNYCAGPSNQNNSEYVVLFHVNPGVTIRFQIGDSLEILRGKISIQQF